MVITLSQQISQHTSMGMNGVQMLIENTVTFRGTTHSTIIFLME